MWRHFCFSIKAKNGCNNCMCVVAGVYVFPVLCCQSPVSCQLSVAELTCGMH